MFMNDFDCSGIPNQMTIEKANSDEMECTNCGFVGETNSFIIDYDPAEQVAFYVCPNCNGEVK